MSDPGGRLSLSREEALVELARELRQLRKKPPEFCDQVDLANIELLERLIQSAIQRHASAEEVRTGDE